MSHSPAFRPARGAGAPKLLPRLNLVFRAVPGGPARHAGALCMTTANWIVPVVIAIIFLILVRLLVRGPRT
jgi:hypothetical protein